MVKYHVSLIREPLIITNNYSTLILLLDHSHFASRKIVPLNDDSYGHVALSLWKNPFRFNFAAPSWFTFHLIAMGEDSVTERFLAIICAKLHGNPCLELEGLRSLFTSMKWPGEITENSWDICDPSDSGQRRVLLVFKNFLKKKKEKEKNRIREFLLIFSV